MILQNMIYLIKIILSCIDVITTEYFTIFLYQEPHQRLSSFVEVIFGEILNQTPVSRKLHVKYSPVYIMGRIVGLLHLLLFSFCSLNIFMFVSKLLVIMSVLS